MGRKPPRTKAKSTTSAAKSLAPDAVKPVFEDQDPKTEQKPAMTRLAEHILARFREAVDFKDKEITGQLLENERQVDGKFDATTEAALAKSGMNKLFFNLTAPKVDTWVAWLWEDLVLSAARSVGIDPTPVPSLSDATPAEIKERIKNRAIEMSEGLAPNGEDLSPQQHADLFEEACQFVEREIMREAKAKADRMERRVYDLFVEGDWWSEIRKFIECVGTYRFGVLRGPEVEMEKKRVWENGKRVVKEVPVLKVWNVSPYNIFWTPNANALTELDVFEIVSFSDQKLKAQGGKNGYNAEAIARVLAEPSHQVYSTESTGENERRDLQHKDETESTNGRANIECIRYSGTVRGDMLLEWGKDFEGLVEPDGYYDIKAECIGTEVIRAILNPDALGRKGYWTTCYKKRRGGIIGASIPDLLAEPQQCFGLIMRTIMNNAAWRGPQWVMDDSYFTKGDEEPIPAPFTVLHADAASRRTNLPGKPFEAIVVPDAANSLIPLKREFEDMADNVSLVPRFMSGALDTGNAAGGTAYGLEQLVSMGRRGVFDSLDNVERDVQVPLVQMVVDWLMDNEPDPMRDGDSQVVVRTTASNRYRRMATQRAFDLLDRTNNPIDQAIMGVEGRRELLRLCVEGVLSELSKDIPVDLVIQTENALRLKKVEEARAQMQAQQQAGVSPQEMPEVPRSIMAAAQRPVNPPNTEAPALSSGVQQEGQALGTQLKDMPASGVTPGA